MYNSAACGIFLTFSPIYQPSTRDQLRKNSWNWNITNEQFELLMAIAKLNYTPSDRK
jgi:hypothetical protein